MSTYTPIASQTLTGNTTKITFSAIPQYYNDLVLVGVITNSTTQIYGAIQFNSDTISSSTNYSTTSLANWQNNIYSDRQSNTYGIATWEKTVGSSVDAAIIIINVFGYSSTAMHKTVITEQSGMYVNLAGSNTGTWRSYDAVNSISYDSANGNNFGAGTTFTLYGIESGNVSAKASGGNIVTTDGSYWYHTFTSSGTFIPSTALTVDYLVVAGGGSGANAGTGGAGGGAGGLRSTVTATGGGGSLESALSLSANTVYQALIGAGGAQPAYDSNGNNGNNSVFATITSIGGGAGAKDDTNGFTGGSGGGAGGVGNRTGGSGTANQGYAGGNSLIGSSSNRPNGGGGGAGAVGVNGTTNNSGSGGAGVAISALATATGTGVSNYYAGGGGGGIGAAGSSAGTGGAGGGGNGNKVTGAQLATAGKANTGGGGGGIDTVNGGGGSSAGGSGIIIIRYAV